VFSTIYLDQHQSKSWMLLHNYADSATCNFISTASSMFNFE